MQYTLFFISDTFIGNARLKLAKNQATPKQHLTLKKRSHRYDINRPRSRHGHKYSKYKKCLSMMMLICIKQHLSNI